MAIVAICLGLCGFLLSFGCAASRLDGTPGSADYCTVQEERTFVSMFFVGVAIGAIEAIVVGLVMARRRWRPKPTTESCGRMQSPQQV